MNTSFLPFPILNTLRLQLRRVNESDIPAILQMRSDPELMKFIDRPLMEGLEEARELYLKIETALTKGEGITWGISLLGEPQLIGTIAFWKLTPEHFRAEIGYMMMAPYQGNGLVQEAMEAILAYGFKVMKVHSVEANINPSNASSRKLLERNGFVKEAYFRENFYYNGQFLDSEIYSLLVHESKLGL